MSERRIDVNGRDLQRRGGRRLHVAWEKDG
jgi:hypothetical protein